MVSRWMGVGLVVAHVAHSGQQGRNQVQIVKMHAVPFLCVNSQMREFSERAQCRTGARAMRLRLGGGVKSRVAGLVRFMGMPPYRERIAPTVSMPGRA